MQILKVKEEKCNRDYIPPLLITKYGVSTFYSAVKYAPSNKLLRQREPNL